MGGKQIIAGGGGCKMTAKEISPKITPVSLLTHLAYNESLHA